MLQLQPKRGTGSQRFQCCFLQKVWLANLQKTIKKPGSVLQIMVLFRIQEMNDHEFFEAVNQDPLFKALSECIIDRVTFRYRATDWTKFMAIWKQIGFNYCIIRNLNSKIRGKGKSMLKLRRNLAIYRLYRYQNIPIKLLIKICQRRRERVMCIIGSVFRMFCMADEKCVLRKYLRKL